MKLSIIVPLYASEKWMRKCIDSLLDQDLSESDYEIILVNDGSPGNDLEIAQEYASQHANIVVLSQPNKGTSGARNTGLRNATGEYVCFVDPDDYVLPNSYGKLVKQMDEERLDMLRFDYQMVNEAYEIIPPSPREMKMDYTPSLMDGKTFLRDRLGIACYMWVYLYRLSIIKDNGIWCYEGDYFDDTPWLPRVLLKSERVNLSRSKVYCYLQRSDSLVKSQSPQSIEKKMKGQRFLIEELGRQKNDCTDSGAIRWYDMMRAHCVLTLLSLVAVHHYNRVKETLHFLKQQNVFPLVAFRSSAAVKKKILLVNLSPKLYCFLLHSKTNNFECKQNASRYSLNAHTNYRE